MNDVIIILVLSFIIVFQAFEKYVFGDQLKKEKEKMLDEMSKLVKALISKNANDYVMTAAIDKVPKEDKIPMDPDLIPEEQLSDDEFMEAIGKRIKDDK